MSTLGTVVTLEHAGMEFVIYVDYYPVIPGRFSGPPEDCYPDEGGEINDWHFMEVNVLDVDEVNLDDLPSQSDLIDEALEIAIAQEDECDLY